MWTAILLAALVGVDEGRSKALTFKNVHATYGELGADRKDNKLLPGDAYHLSFDVEGFKSDDDGKIRYSMALEVTNSQGKSVYRRDARDLETVNPFGGDRVHFFPIIQVGFQHPPGEYTVSVTAKDRSTGATGVLSRKIEILAPAFGLVNLQTWYTSPSGRVQAPAGGVTGQLLTVSFSAVGFDRDATTKQANVAVELRILDENGKPTLPKSIPGALDQVPEGWVIVPMSYDLPLTRPGKFTLKLRGTDMISKKTAELTLPITVAESRSSEGTKRDSAARLD